ncbi:MAG: hypothetical protein GXO28_00545, partial [Methanopyri archaeon]|nr:hypothetical protein [Methanopyri archaeon]
SKYREIIAKLKKKIEELKEERKQLMKEIEELKKENEELKTKLRQLTEKVKEMKEELEKKEQKIQKMRDTIVTLKDKIEERDKKIKVLKKERDELQEVVRKYEEGKQLVIPSGTEMAVGKVDGDIIIGENSVIRSLDSGTPILVKNSLIVRSNVEIHGTIIAKKVELGDNVKVHGNILCKDECTIGRGTVVEGNVVSVGSVQSAGDLVVKGHVIAGGSMSFGDRSTVENAVLVIGNVSVSNEFKAMCLFGSTVEAKSRLAVEYVFSDGEVHLGDDSVVKTVITRKGPVEQGVNSCVVEGSVSLAPLKEDTLYLDREMFPEPFANKTLEAVLAEAERVGPFALVGAKNEAKFVLEDLTRESIEALVGQVKKEVLSAALP